MTDHTPAPEPRGHDPVVAAAADRLRSDADKVDTMAAMHRVAGGSAWFRPAVLVGGLAVVLLAVIGAVALLNDGDGESIVADGDQDTPVVHELEGTSWTFVAGGDIAPPEGWPITISFDRDTFGGTASCNGYGGSFTLDGSGGIALSDVGSTAMACEPAATMEAEAAFLTALSGVDSYDVTGDTLQLFGDTVELIFERQAPLPTADLVGQLWLLDTLIRGETATSPSGDPATLLLRPDGTLEGGTGCRSLTGTWVEAGGQIVFTEFAAEGNTCTPDLTDQDNLVVTVLGDGFVPTIDGTRLTVTSAGDEGLSYRAIDEVPDPVARETLAEQLTGTSWSFLEGQGPTGPIIASNPILIEFSDGGIEGQAPCNTFSATTVFDGDRIEISNLVTTEVACADLDAEVEFYAGLADISSIAVEGSDDPLLVLAGGSSEMIFERADVDPDPGPEPTEPPVPSDSEFLTQLASTRWRLVDSAALDIATSGVTLEFSEDGTFVGEAHCNAYGGTFTLAAERLRFGPIEAQEEGCARSADESAYFAALGEVDLAVIAEDGSLVLDLGLNELIFAPEDGTQVPEPAPAEYSVSELLDLRPEGVVTVVSGAITYGDTTILCDAQDLNPDDPTRCPGRWVVVTNYNELVDGRGPFDGVLRDDGRFQIVGPASGVEERPSGVDETAADAAIADELIGGPTDLGALPWADEVELWLGTEIVETRTSEEMLDPANWVFAVEDFEGFAGPFDMIAILMRSEAPEVLVGPHDHCAGQPLALPDSLLGLRQISIQPTGIDSCIAWFAVDVFINQSGEIQAMMLDLFGP